VATLLQRSCLGHRKGNGIGSWPGNTTDSALIRQAKADLRDWTLARVVWVGDRGFTQGVGKVRNVGLDLRRWQSAARVQTQSLLSGSLPARSRLSSRPGQRGLAVPLPAIRRHSARNCHVSTGASAQLKRLVSDFADPLAITPVSANIKIACSE
jgi:hypothetical protein